MMSTRLALAALAVVGLAAGCGGSSLAAKPPVTVTVTATPTATGPTATSSSTATPTSASSTGPAGSTTTPADAAPSRCLTSNLNVSVKSQGAAAGTAYSDIVFENRGTASCTLRGYPGVSYTTSSHAQIGRPAAHGPGGSHEATVSLAPGHTASAALRQPNAQNYDPSSCHPTTSTYLKVYPPNETVPVYLSDHVVYCSNAEARAGVTPVQSGSNASYG